MKYVFLFYQDEEKLGTLPEDELRALVNEVVDYREHLQESGQYIASSRLESVQCATTLRVRNGKMAITDGPYAETKEQLGGLFLVEARDLNEAIRIAARFPAARLGSVEVRPLMESSASSSSSAV